MNITLEEARMLYAQDGVARKVALRAYSEGEILNDYTTITKLPEEQKNTPTSDLYAKLYAVYKAMSAGRLVSLTSGTSYYQPQITISHVIQKPRHGNYVGKVDIDSGLVYSVYIDTCTTMYGGRFDWEGDGVYMGDGLFSNKWIFKEREQAEKFLKYPENVQLLKDYFMISRCKNAINNFKV